MLDRLDETIVAISSAPGKGPVGLVRLSGPRAIALADQICRLPQGRRLADHPAWTRTAGEVEPEAGVSFPAFCYVFRAPRSYTRQDIIEIYTVGSPVVLELVRQACVARGALPAEPGEFTARAFANGAMDLAQAEAVANLIRAQSDAQLRASRRMLDGALARQISDLRGELAELLALVEADIDFAEEPIEFITPADLQLRANRLVETLTAMLAAAPPVEQLSRLPHVLLLGPPNAGKSSLMNVLSGVSRAICAAAAGTTRDILSAPIRVGRGEAILLDAAGVDESEDEIIAQARTLTLAAAERVDLVCLVIDATTLRADVPAGEPFTGRRHELDLDPSRDREGAVAGQFLERVRGLDLPVTVVAANKCDLLSPADLSEAISLLREMGLGPVVAVSALAATGIDALRDAFGDRLGGSETTAGGEAVFMTERQRFAANEALSSIHRAVELAGGATETIDCADVLAFELREALDALGTVTGAVTTEELLAHVFANFCIGK